MKSSFSKIFIPLLIVLLTALMVIGISFQLLVKHVLRERSISNLKQSASVIEDLAGAYVSGGSFFDEDFVINLSVSAQVTGYDAVICNTRGVLIMCSDAPLGCNHQGMVISESYLKQVLSRGTVQSTGLIQGLYTDSRYVVATALYDGFGWPIGIAIVSTPTSENASVLGKMSEIYMIVSVLVVLASIIIISLLLRRQNLPLKDMAKAASDFGHGNLDARVHVDERCSQEMQELALAFNNMASSLQKSEYQRQEFVANVSHELKTPMTTISGFVDGILDGTIPPEKQSHYMQLVSNETKRLNRLVRSMLDISKLQDQVGIPEEKKNRFDLTELTGQVLITFERKILEKELEVHVDMPDHPVFTRAVEDSITQVIYNLMDNAVKFCPQGGKLEVRIRLGGSRIYFSLSNDGQTIPAQELPLVFDRFHKMDKSRSENRDGWGLGLYIVKTIIGSHGENISVTSQNGVTEFTFTLPLIN